MDTFAVTEGLIGRIDDLIGGATRDDRVGADAMRWRPEPSVSTAAVARNITEALEADRVAARARVEIEYSDGERHTYELDGPHITAEIDYDEGGYEYDISLHGRAEPVITGVSPTVRFTFMHMRHLRTGVRWPAAAASDGLEMTESDERR